MSQFAQRLAALSPEKLMLLERRIKERNGSVSPSAPLVAELPRLSANEEAQLREWNNTAVEYDHAEVCLHELFAVQAERTPGQVAVIAGQQQWTYEELNEQARQVAGRLQQLGVAVEERVGICVERALEKVDDDRRALGAKRLQHGRDDGMPCRTEEHVIDERLVVDADGAETGDQRGREHEQHG